VTWALAGAFVVSGWLAIAALRAGSDPVVAAALEPARSRGVLRQPKRTLARPGFLAAVGGVVGLSVVVVDPVLGVVTGPVLIVAGWRLPRFLEARAAGGDRQEASASVPELLDVVAVAVTAGLSPRLALDRAAGAILGPLGDAMGSIRREVQLGGTWTGGLRQAAERMQVSELRRLAVVIDQGRRLGAPVAERLRALATDVRAERRARREERARRAPVAMLFPLVFLILPAFVLAAVVPAVLVAIRGIT
jgi:tight adherence protein C